MVVGDGHEALASADCRERMPKSFGMKILILFRCVPGSPNRVITTRAPGLRGGRSWQAPARRADAAAAESTAVHGQNATVALNRANP